jgi:hypothetical protein
VKGSSLGCSVGAGVVVVGVVGGTTGVGTVGEVATFIGVGVVVSVDTGIGDGVVGVGVTAGIFGSRITAFEFEGSIIYPFVGVIAILV